MEVGESVEARWFFEHDDPRARALDAWFARVPSEGEREDRYLATGRDDLGIKVRAAGQSAARFETKYLVERMGVISLARAATAQVERWRKVSVESSEPVDAADGAWITVRKDRRLRKFAWTGDAEREVDGDVRPDAGCIVEWTELAVVRGDVVVARSKTIGLEAFGRPDALRTVLLTVGGGVLRDEADLALAVETSMGYPAWLRAVGARAAT